MISCIEDFKQASISPFFLSQGNGYALPNPYDDLFSWMNLFL